MPTIIKQKSSKKRGEELNPLRQRYRGGNSSDSGGFVTTTLLGGTVPDLAEKIVTAVRKRSIKRSIKRGIQSKTASSHPDSIQIDSGITHTIIELLTELSVFSSDFVPLQRCQSHRESTHSTVALGDPFAEITRTIESALSGVQAPKGVEVIDFRVSLGSRKRGQMTPQVVAVHPERVAKKVSAFDPIEAGRQAVEAMKKAEGGAWTGAELQKCFALSSAALHKRRTTYGVVYWKDAKNRFFYPKWQFNEAGALLPGVQKVLQIFHSSDEWRVMRYFLGKRTQLGDLTPLSLLRAGEVERVVAHAKLHVEENTW